MNIKALITTLFVVGSSSVALAQPASRVEVREAPTAVIVKHDRAPVIVKHAPEKIIVKHEPEKIIVKHDRAPIVIDRGYVHAPIVINRTYQAPIVVNEYRAPSWTLLSSSNQISQDGRTTIGLGDSELRTLKLAETSGKTTVSEVAIQFADGQSQVDYTQTLLANGGTYTIDLNGNVRSVDSITVFGRGTHNASFEVLGS